VRMCNFLERAGQGFLETNEVRQGDTREGKQQLKGRGQP